MRICASCGYILNDDEMVCPFCGEGTAGDLTAGETGLTDGSPDDTPEEAGIAEADVPDPVTEDGANGTEESIPDTAETQDCTEGSPADTGETGDITGVSSEAAPEDVAAAVFHREDDAEDRILRKRSGLFSKVMLILAALAVAGIIFGIVLPYFRLNDDSDAAKEKAYMDFICGTWISNSFVYSDGSFPSKEILIVNKDYTYTSYIVASPDGSEEYDRNTWKVTDSDEGVFSISIEDSAIAVTYNTTSGDSYSYLRYIRRLDGSSLTLREYYNEQMTDYFDVIFTRMEG